MCVLVFLVLTELSPGVAILVLNGVFFVQILIDVRSSIRRKPCPSDNCPRRWTYDTIGEEDDREYEDIPNPLERRRHMYYMKCLRGLQGITEHYVVKVIAGLLQLIGVAGLIGYWVYKVRSGHGAAKSSVYTRALISLPLVLLALSVIWSNKFQEAIARSHVRKNDKKVSARYKSSELILAG